MAFFIFEFKSNQNNTIEFSICQAEFAPPPDDDTDGASTDTPANNETDSSNRRKRESEMTPEEERIALRLAELAVTHSGLEDCMPPKEGIKTKKLHHFLMHSFDSLFPK